MKKFYFFALALSAATVMSVGLASCSDDDDNGGGSVTPSAAPSPSIINVRGETVHVTSYRSNRRDEYLYEYDENGKLAKIASNVASAYGYDYDVWYEGGPFVLTVKFNDEEQDYQQITHVSLNAQGYVSRYSTQTQDVEYDDDQKISESSTYNAACQYNDEGRLVKHTASYKWSGIEGEEKYAGNGSISSEYIWENGKLTKIVYSWSETEDGEQDNGGFVKTFTYGSQTNPAKQWLQEMGEGMDGAENYVYVLMPHALMPLGLFGHGPDYLPTGYSSVEDEEDTKNGTLEYTLNADGTIHTDNRRYYYTYDSGVSVAVKAQAPQWQSAEHKSRLHRMHHHAFKHRKL